MKFQTLFSESQQYNQNRFHYTWMFQTFLSFLFNMFEFFLFFTCYPQGNNSVHQKMTSKVSDGFFKQCLDLQKCIWHSCNHTSRFHSKNHTFIKQKQYIFCFAEKLVLIINLKQIIFNKKYFYV